MEGLAKLAVAESLRARAGSPTEPRRESAAQPAMPLQSMAPSESDEAAATMRRMTPPAQAESRGTESLGAATRGSIERESPDGEPRAAQAGAGSESWSQKPECSAQVSLALTVLARTAAVPDGRRKPHRLHPRAGTDAVAWPP